MGCKRVDGFPLWECEECGALYINKLQAELCHKKYYCEVCGKETERYALLCEQHMKEKELSMAEQLTYDEYKNKYPNYMISYDGECYYDLDELIEVLTDRGEEIPEYCYGTEPDDIKVDIDYAIECAEDDVEEPFWNGDELAELRSFVNEWNKKYGYQVFYQDKKKIVFLPKIVKEARYE